MRLKKIFIVATLLFATPACAATYRVIITPTPDETTRMDSGVESFLSFGPSAIVAIPQPRQGLNGRSGFRVYASNLSQIPFNFGPENVSITFMDGTSIAMDTYAQLAGVVKRAENGQRVAAILGAIGRGMQNYRAGSSSGTVEYSGTTTGTVAGAPYSARTYGSGSYTTYDRQRAQEAQDEAEHESQNEQQQLMAARAEHQQELAAVMQTTTVDPGKAFGGVVMFDIPTAYRHTKDPVAITINVGVGGETHIFHGTLVRER
jgi:hypothetical protein